MLMPVAGTQHEVKLMITVSINEIKINIKLSSNQSQREDLFGLVGRGCRDFLMYWRGRVISGCEKKSGLARQHEGVRGVKAKLIRPRRVRDWQIKIE